jgi:hypothetical protein
MAEVQQAPMIDKTMPDKAGDGIQSSGTNGSSKSPSTPDQIVPDPNKKALQHQTSVGSMGSPEPLPSDDLPEELLQIGWRKYWSKRENMPYYFNKITNESLWEMPQLLHVRLNILYEFEVLVHLDQMFM